QEGSDKSALSFVLPRPAFTPSDGVLVVLFVWLLLSGGFGGKVVASLALFTALLPFFKPGLLVFGRNAIALSGAISCRIAYANIAQVSTLETVSRPFFSWNRPNMLVRTHRLFWVYRFPLILPTKSIQFLLRDSDCEGFVTAVSSRAGHVPSSTPTKE
ncbi:MAG TPA: hypothetical protein VFX19_05745, partial [Dehalococcoidia bacterium]|nr:hypothetical protein [Dehalococcoidia bacterium]